MLPMPNLTAYAAVAVVAAALASAGAWQAQEWRYGAKETQRLQSERVAEELRQADERQARALNDKAAACMPPRLHASTLNLEPPMRASPLSLLIVLASTAALSACSTTSASPPAGLACEPLPATLRVRPQPLPDLQMTVLPQGTPVNATQLDR